MTVRAAKKGGQLPSFTWDPVRLRLVSANAAGLAFWGEDSLTDLTERMFAPGDETVRALAARLAQIEEGGDGAGRLIFTPSGAPILTNATCQRDQMPGGRVLLHVTLNEISPPDDAVLARMHAGFDSATQAMAIIDANGTVLTRNEADRRSFADAEGQFTCRFDVPQEAETALSVALSDGAFSRKSRLRASAGVAPFRVSLRRMRDPVTGEIAAIATFTDLTDRPVATDPQSDSGERLNIGELAALTHDLRAPLTAIQGFAEFIAMSDAGISMAQRASYLADIGTASRRMQAVIDRIVTRAASPLEKVSLSATIAAAVRLYQPQALSAGMALSMGTIDPLLSVRAEAVTLTRILDNLVGNALTHGVSTGGTVQISAATDGASITVEVADDGPGLDNAALAAALTPFASAQPAGRSGGLGLSNCKALAEEIGAHLEIVTAPGQGLSARLIFRLV